MRFRTLDDWLSWQERLHPSAIDLGLERVAEVWRRLCPSGFDCPVVTVGGTNGKGSCVAMLEAILQAAGYRTGCYSSPHLLRYNERIHLHGTEVSDAELCDAFERVDLAREGTSLTYFEFGTLAALDLFARGRLDVVVLEVGLGGRLDAVNVLDADVAIVTTVGLDHTAWLGEDLDSIAREKAGIFRADRPAVIGQIDPPAGLLDVARTLGARVFLAGRDFTFQTGEHAWCWSGADRSRTGLPRPGMRSACQFDNAAAVLMALHCLSARLPVDQGAIRLGLQQAQLAGRLQVVPGDITLIMDVAHNGQAVRNLVRDLQSLPYTGTTHAVFACFRDKDVSDMVMVLSHAVEYWHLASPVGRRALAAEALELALIDADVSAPRICYPSVAEALIGARQLAKPGDRILITGSFLTVAAALETLSGVNVRLV